jgi:hypothetical protein
MHNPRQRARQKTGRSRRYHPPPRAARASAALPGQVRHRVSGAVPVRGGTQPRRLDGHRPTPPDPPHRPAGPRWRPAHHPWPRRKLLPEPPGKLSRHAPRASGPGCTVPHRGHVTAATAPGARQRYRQIHRCRQRTVVLLASTSPAPSGPSLPQPGHSKPGGISPYSGASCATAETHSGDPSNGPAIVAHREHRTWCASPPATLRWRAMWHTSLNTSISRRPGPHPPQTRRHLPAFQVPAVFATWRGPVAEPAPGTSHPGAGPLAGPPLPQPVPGSGPRLRSPGDVRAPGGGPVTCAGPAAYVRGLACAAVRVALAGRCAAGLAAAVSPCRPARARRE